MDMSQEFTEAELKEIDREVELDTLDMQLTMPNVKKFLHEVDDDEEIRADTILAAFFMDKTNEYIKRNAANQYLRRLAKDGVLRKIRHGVYRKPTQLHEIDFGADEEEYVPANLKLPLNAQSIVDIQLGELVIVGGQVNAGKSTFIFEILAHNYKDWPIRYFFSKEITMGKIISFAKRMNVDRQHPNIKAYEMKTHFEDIITGEKAIYLFDYIRLGKETKPWEVDAQLAEVLERIGEGIAFTAIQAHSGDGYKMKGGDYALMVPHHGFILNRDTGLAMVVKSKTPDADFKVKQYKIANNGFTSEYKHWIHIDKLKGNSN